MLSKLYEYLSGKRVVILGFGREGRSSLKYILAHKKEIKPRSIVVADQNDIDESEMPEGVGFVCGAEYLDSMREADIVLKTPGISFRQFNIQRKPEGIFLEEYPGAEISGQTDLFFRFGPARCVGVTGTKGKSTTTTLCYEILAEAKGPDKAFLIGNIGVPVFDRLDAMKEDTYCAVELSSHQLEFCGAAPEVAVLTNFYEEHLDHYRSYDAYIDAKLNILRGQNEDGTAVMSANAEELMAKAPAFVKGRLLLAADRERQMFGPKPADYILGDGRAFTVNGESEELPENPAMLGRHVYLDALLALAATSVFGIPLETQLAGIRKFQGIPHRLEPLGYFGGILFYNDSIATIPEPVERALEALKPIGEVTTLLAGGNDRGIDYRDFAAKLFRTSVRSLICMPDTGSILKALVEKRNQGLPAGHGIRCYDAENMREAVKLAYLLTRPGEICLLSPAASSYNRYKSFEERGNDFKAQVKELEGVYGGTIKNGDR